MFLSGRELESGAEVRVDICIAGAGAAGIAIARALIGTGKRVALLAGGGTAFDRRAQELYRGWNAGTEAFSPYTSRARVYGGATTLWAGQCRPFDAIDFERRDWVPDSGWPFDRRYLEPWYERAQAVCNLGPYDYAPSSWTTDGRAPLPVDPTCLEVRIYQFAWPTDFGAAYREELAAAPNVDVYLNSHVVEIELDPDVRRVVALKVAMLGGRRARVVAEGYVLACGGLENPRLLLASNAVATRGVGNEHDLVGRYYTDHPYFFMGRFEPSRPEYDRSLHVIEDYKRVGWEQRAHAAVALPERIIRTEQLNGSAVYFIRRPGYKTDPVYFRPAVRSFTRLVDATRQRDLPGANVGRYLRQIASGIPDVARSLARQAAERFAPRPTLALRTALEATPNRDSRVSLARDRDELGVPRVQVDWRLNASDRRGLERLHEVMRAEFARQGVGHVVEDLTVDSAGWPVSMSSGMHHMGTTRMHDDPTRGVVDANCRVHGVANLYIAGSSVFPTGGVANPTLTIVALALRLAATLADTG